MKKIVFRLNYRTVAGQSLWVRISLRIGSSTFEHLLPMRWINGDQWQAEWETAWNTGQGFLLFTYRYLFRQESNGIELEEWGSPRMIGAFEDAVVALDTWCSAGSVDYAYETKAFRVVAKPRPLSEVTSRGNHDFQIRVAGVPDGQAVCLLGNAVELGGWDASSAQVMSEVSPDVWKVRVAMPPGRDVEYKYGLADLATGRLVDLEQGGNRFFHSPLLADNQTTRISDEVYRRDTRRFFHGAGVAVPVFSLRSPEGLGVGEFADLKALGDWTSSIGMKLIQILPVNDTTSTKSWTDSYPYSAISAFALHPIYLRIDDLPYAMDAEFSGRVKSERERLNAADAVDYEAVMAAKTAFLREIYGKHRRDIMEESGFREFVAANRGWLIPYATFCLLRDQNGTADFSKWGGWSRFDWKKVDALVHESGEHWPEIAFHLWCQYELDRQLSDAVAHLHAKGVALKGDLPIGIDRESVDAWSAPHLYHMDTQTGAPPDAFAVNGQNWGFPTYNWQVMKQDGYAWWRSRFGQLAKYFDAFRIDHILGFFRIWSIPADQVDGIMGWFDPALAIRGEEFAERGIYFDKERFCEPWLTGETLAARFGGDVEMVKERYLREAGFDRWRFRPEFSKQRKIAALPDSVVTPEIRRGLMDCASDVLFFETPEGFHPRCELRSTRSFMALDPDTRWKVGALHDDYFYRRQESFWEARGFEKLPAMRRASDMLLCGEDLGMVPACVPGVLRETGILSLEIQRMPKLPGLRFFDPSQAPYMSVVSPGTHDMETLREWWLADPEASADFAWEMFGIGDPPAELSGALAERIIDQHLRSPAMWAIFPLQDLLAMDEKIRLPDPKAERINVPAVMPWYWRYRMHLGLADLASAGSLNDRLGALVRAAGR